MILGATVPSSPLFWISFITGLLGAICIAVYTYPSMIQTLRTKNTTGVPVIMFTILGLGSLFFLINGATGIAYNAGEMGLGWEVWAIMIGLTVANAFSFVSACITMGMKIRNIHLAKKYHMTEAQLCDRLARLAGIQGYHRGDDPERAKFKVDKEAAKAERARDAALIKMKMKAEAKLRLHKIEQVRNMQRAQAAQAAQAALVVEAKAPAKAKKTTKRAKKK